MFQKLRNRLLLTYIVVIASILGVFATAIHIVFTNALSQEFTEKLTALAQGAAANTELEQSHLKVGDDFSSKDLIARNQGLQWFDTQGNIIAQQGRDILTLPLSINEPVQVQVGTRIQGVTLPIINSDDGSLIGYVRASQLMEPLDITIEKLNLGLGSGIAIALVLSSISGFWLTRQAMQPIEQSFQRLKQFTADASHELRGPLMAIKSNAAVALKYSQGMRSTDAEKFKAIASATNQMSRLTEDLLFLARAEQIPTSEWVSVNLTEILNNLLVLYKSQAEAKKIDLTANLTTDLNLLANQAQLTRLFSNLIENALQYTPVAGKVKIQTNKVSGYVFISVIDTGIGIAPEHLEIIFDRFWRANQSRSYWAGGSGLGLAIAQTIAQNHHGSITVKSQVEVGSCFTIQLPIETDLSTE